MWRTVVGLDSLLSITRPAWLWLGQLSLLFLGIHFSCDQLDDALIPALANLPVPWPSPETPITAATYCALAGELSACVWGAWALLRATDHDASTSREWLSRWSVHNVSAPIVWVCTALAGCWAVWMAMEDWIAPWHPALATPIAALITGGTAWRLGWTGWVQILRRSPACPKRSTGLFWLLVLTPITVLAVRHGWPLWGWLP